MELHVTVIGSLCCPFVSVFCDHHSSLVDHMAIYPGSVRLNVFVLWPASCPSHNVLFVLMREPSSALFLSNHVQHNIVENRLSLDTVHNIRNNISFIGILSAYQLPSSS